MKHVKQTHIHTFRTTEHVISYRGKQTRDVNLLLGSTL